MYELLKWLFFWWITFVIQRERILSIRQVPVLTSKTFLELRGCRIIMNFALERYLEKRVFRNEKFRRRGSFSKWIVFHFVAYFNSTILPYWYKKSRVLKVARINCRAKILRDFATFSTQRVIRSGFSELWALVAPSSDCSVNPKEIALYL